MTAIEIKNLRKKYGDLQAVKGISFKVEKGDFFGFIGPNGAGKTTTIECVMDLLKYEGKITVMGHDAKHEYRAAQRKIGLSPQEYNFDRFLTVEQCLTFTAGYYGLDKETAKKNAESWLKKVGLWDKRKKKTDSLSGGMKRRLIIARSMVHDPDIVILDEPTAGIDVELRREIWSLLTDINKQGKTIILTSHYIEEVEKLCDTVCIIHKGNIREYGKKKDIMADLSDQTLELKTNKKVPKKLVENKHLVVKQENGTIKITGKDIRKKAKDIIKNIEDEGITVEEMNMYHESLEEVFLRVTSDKK